MTIRVTTDIVFDGCSAVEIQQAGKFEDLNDMDVWERFEAANCIVFRKTEETDCDPISRCPKCGEDLRGKTDG